MKKTATLLTFLILEFAISGIAHSADMFCICPKIPLYSVGGGNWFHYAIVCKQGNMPGCIDQYPTGWTGSPMYARSCSNTANGCDNCNSLGPAAGKVSDLYFGTANSTAPPYLKLDDATEIKDFMKSVDNSPAAGDVYDNVTFFRPRPAKYPYPIVVKLSRDVKGTNEYFDAVVWRMRGDEVETRANVGFEVSGYIPPEVEVTPVSFCNAVSTEKDGTTGAVTHTPVPGLLEIQLFSEKDEVAYIRLQNSDKNRNANYPSCPK